MNPVVGIPRRMAVAASSERPQISAGSLRLHDGLAIFSN